MIFWKFHHTNTIQIDLRIHTILYIFNIHGAHVQSFKRVSLLSFFMSVFFISTLIHGSYFQNLSSFNVRIGLFIYFIILLIVFYIDILSSSIRCRSKANCPGFSSIVSNHLNITIYIIREKYKLMLFIWTLTFWECPCKFATYSAYFIARISSCLHFVEIQNTYVFRIFFLDHAFLNYIWHSQYKEILNEEI